MSNPHVAKTGALKIFSRRGRKILAFACLLAAAPMAAGCYGRFPMTHALYRMNGDVENKIVKNVVFWLLVWFPIYWFAQIGDAVIFNLIEFWTGSELELSTTTKQGDRTIALESAKGGKELIMTVSMQGEIVDQSRFIRVAEGRYEVRDERNRLAGMVIRTPNGDLNLTDARGKTLHTISATAIASARTGSDR